MIERDPGMQRRAIPAARGEPLYDLPARAQPLEAVRGALFFTDWAWLRAHDRYARYCGHLPADAKDAILGVTSAQWVPVAWLLAHDRAIDRLGLTRDEAFQAGFEGAQRVHGAFLATLVRLAGALGAAPWVALKQAYKLWTRSWRGGFIAVERMGAQDARVVIDSGPLSQVAFHRASLSGAVAGGIASFCARCDVVELDAERTGTSYALALHWR